ncbi:hypothetical protein [Marivirga arenosa]|uniref:Carboxypeptidase-like protein n=1 Tax=Marivirga arenosa TaxID=3059076 RepID=A0AA51X3S5_9BACT|nr:hypothetical protein [Marivirga sp. BKB1-2]WNB17227.1 hypothetical protein QYS47_33305 [Marivirga sp. BKB1-2]
MRKFLIIQMVMNLIFVLSVFSQEPISDPENTITLKGRVLSEDSSAVDFAYVIAQEVVSGKVLNYTFSSDKGYFSLDLVSKDDSVVLIFSRLGYVKKELTVNSYSDSLFVVLSMDSSNFLNEVKVIPDVITSSEDSDTISYFANSFIDGTETNVEDLLEKMPGFSINNETGEIKYQGKTIKKILLDGDDLTGTNYKVISKNLSADLIEEIEVLKNFSDLRLLKGIKKSEDVAINLKIKDELKSPFFGNAKLGGGTNSRYSGDADILSYNKAMKLYFIASANNTGYDLESYDLETYMDINMAEYKGFFGSSEILEGRLEAPPFFPEDKFTFHQGQFLSNTMLVNLSEHSNLKSTSTFYNNDINFNFRDSINYLIDEENLFIFEQERFQNKKPLEFFQGIEYTSQLSKKEDLKAKIQFRKSIEDISSLNLNSFNTIEDQMLVQKDLLYSNVSYQRQLNSKWVFTTEFEGNFDNLTEEISIQNDQLDNLDSSLQQKSSQALYNVGATSSFIGLLKNNWQTNLSISFIHSSSQMDIGDGQDFFYPRSELTVNNFSVETEIVKWFKNHKVFFRPKFKNLYYTKDGSNSSNFLVEPQIGAVFKDKFFQNLNAEMKVFGHREFNLLEPTQLLSTSLLIDNRTTATYQTEVEELVKRDVIAANIALSDMNNTFISGSLEAGLVRAENELFSRVSFEDEIVSIEYSQADNVEQSFFSSSLDKYWPSIKSTFKFIYEYKTSSTPLVIEDIEASSILSQKALSFTSGSSLTSSINLSLGVKHNSILNIWGERDVRMAYNNYNSKLNFKFLPRALFSFEFMSLHFQNLQDGFNPILNSLVRSESENGKFTFELRANNILNNNNVAVNNIELTSFSANIFPLMNNFYLFSIKYRF